MVALPMPKTYLLIGRFASALLGAPAVMCRLRPVGSVSGVLSGRALFLPFTGSRLWRATDTAMALGGLATAMGWHAPG
ncbi:hypothetical protein GCM10010327_61410 [Streptomyces nitrosporeus]|nr:hypothetical protein GCM10010327_61410 [Streptomyces nitrosporeus]